MDENHEKVKHVTVEIPEEAWEAAAKFVPEGATPDERLPPLIAAAFEEWAHWMEGSFRPTSISELETSRAYELYARFCCAMVVRWRANHTATSCRYFTLFLRR